MLVGRTTITTKPQKLPVLSDNERAELLASLKEAEAQIQAGNSTEYAPKTFKDRLVGIYRGAKR